MRQKRRHLVKYSMKFYSWNQNINYLLAIILPYFRSKSRKATRLKLIIHTIRSWCSHTLNRFLGSHRGRSIRGQMSQILYSVPSTRNFGKKKVTKPCSAQQPTDLWIMSRTICNTRHSLFECIFSLQYVVFESQTRHGLQLKIDSS